MRPCRKCGKQVDLLPYRVVRSDYICRPCHDIERKKYARAPKPRSTPWKPMTKESKAKKRISNARYEAKKACDPRHAGRSVARLLVWNAVRIGYLVRQPCEVCGNLTVDAHHDDYSKPLEVRWLCRTHHGQLHKSIKALPQNAGASP